MKYAHIEDSGRLLGWYDADIHTTIPDPNIAVTDDTWLNALESKHNKVNTDGTTERVDFRTSDEMARDMRSTRNLLLQAKVDPIASNALRWAALSEASQAEWAAYRQALLDVPQQSGFPDNITWPQEPTT